MLSHFVIVCCLSVFVTDSSAIIQATSKYVFGDLWRFDQYCGDDRSNEQILEDDELSQRIFNGSILTSTTQFGIEEIDNLTIYVIKSRASVGSCATKLWGYSDAYSFDQGNQPYQNDDDCRSNLDKLHQYMLELEGKLEHPVSSTRNAQANLYLQLNSFGRVPYGPLHTAQIWVGDYDTCLSIPSTRYCFGSYETQPNNHIRISSGFRGFKVGLCLPRACTSNVKHNQLYLDKIDDLVKYNMLIGFGLNNSSRHRLTDIYCPPAEDSIWMNPFKDITSVMLVIVASLWLAMLLISTFYSELSKRSNGMISKFNLIENWRNLVEDRRTINDMSPLDFLKVFGMIWILFTHYLIITIGYTKEIDRATREPFLTVINQSHHAVSVFFVISCYLSSKSYFNKSKHPGAIKMILDRYIRLALLYVIVYIYVKKFLHMLSSGPFWDHGVSPQSDVRQCQRESPLVPIFMISNFVQPHSHCIVTGWYISNDFQLFILLSLCLPRYIRNRRLSRLMVGLVYILSNLLHVWNYHNAENISISQLYEDSLIFGSFIISSRMALDYINPIGRAGTYFMGLFIADITNSPPMNNHDIPSVEKLEKARETRLRARKFLSLGLCLISWSLSGPLLPNSIKYGWFGPLNKALAYQFMKINCDLGFSMIIYSIIIDGQVLNNGSKTAIDSIYAPLRSNIWTTFSKLNYSIMISHYTLYRILFSGQSQLIPFNYITIAQGVTLAIVCSYILALILHIGVEIPLNSVAMRLVDRVLGPKTAVRRSSEMTKLRKIDKQSSSME